MGNPRVTRVNPYPAHAGLGFAGYGYGLASPTRGLTRVMHYPYVRPCTKLQAQT